MRGFLAAAAIGYVAGLLWAPRKGELLRAEIKDNFLGFRRFGISLLSAAECSAREVVCKAIIPAVEQAEHEVRTLQREGAAIAQDLKKSADQAIEKGRGAVDSSSTRIKEKTNTAMSIISDEAKGLGEHGAEMIKRTGGANS
jgi:gas vesicle protein